jgi:hypothetical protein
MANAPVTELVLSPRWTVTVGHIGGTPHVILRIDHPRLGPLDFLLPDNHAIEFAAALEKTWERRDAGRMSPAAPQSGDDIEKIPAHRPRRGRWWSRLLRNDPAVTTKFIATTAAAEKRRSRGSGKEPV